MKWKWCRSEFITQHTVIVNIVLGNVGFSCVCACGLNGDVKCIFYSGL